MYTSDVDMASRAEATAMSSTMTEIDPDQLLPTYNDNDFIEDEESLEQIYDRSEGQRRNMIRFQVNVPPGRLGMMLDATDGIPTVHTIKPDSIFATRNVKVGDHLVAVDDVDVRGLAAVDVSQLIVMKAQQPRRLFTFERKQRAAKDEEEEV